MDAALTREYESYEERHWWSVARREILHAMLDQYVPGAAEGKGRWLDVGCGAGVLLGTYRGFAERVGAELDADLVERSSAKGRNVRRTGPDWDFSELGQFDCVSLFDVLEHVENEQPAIDAVRSALKDGGIFMITVPAFMTLWTDHDVVSQHFRRYRATQLGERFASKEWEIVKLTYFSTLLFPIIWSVRMFKRLKKKLHPQSVEAPKHDIKFGNPLADRILEHVFRLEKSILKRGSLPIGSSVLIVLRKKSPRPEKID